MRGAFRRPKPVVFGARGSRNPITTISGPAHVVDGDSVVVLLMALLLGAELVLSYLRWKAKSRSKVIT
jgi:hypothetical protein